MNIEVSVVIPCYNSESCIGKCIDSVLAQSFEKFEILAIDDASLDGTLSCLNSYEDPRLRIIQRDQNSGSPAVPRNTGIREAKGSYIAFLDSDDFWHPDKLRHQLNYMKENAYQFSCTDYIISDVDGSEHKREARVLAGLPDLLTLNTVGCSTVMIFKELISNFEFRNCPHEDFDMWLRILGAKNKVYGLNEDLTTYAKRKDSRSRLSFFNVVGLHALFKTHGQVGNMRAFFMMAQYLRKRGLL